MITQEPWSSIVGKSTRIPVRPSSIYLQPYIFVVSKTEHELKRPVCRAKLQGYGDDLKPKSS
jgi:hypothetical protein